MHSNELVQIRILLRPRLHTHTTHAQQFSPIPTPTPTAIYASVRCRGCLLHIGMQVFVVYAPIYPPVHPSLHQSIIWIHVQTYINIRIEISEEEYRGINIIYPTFTMIIHLIGVILQQESKAKAIRGDGGGGPRFQFIPHRSVHVHFCAWGP